MKDRKVKSIKQKIIISLLTVMLVFTCIVPTYSQADAGGVLLEPICNLLQAIGDIANNLIGKTVGTGDSLTSVAIRTGSSREEAISELNSESSGSDNLIEKDIKIVPRRDEDKNTSEAFIRKEDDIIIPCIKVTPAEIFAGRVAFLDADFFGDTDSTEYEETMIGGSSNSTARKLRGIISSWYQGLRLIAIVGLLSVLVYIGIRIVTSAIATDKAKYKQMFVDWVIALCLVFFLHYIMVFSMTMVKEIQKLFVPPNDTKTINTIMVNVTDINGNTVTLGSTAVKFPTNLVGYDRMLAENPNAIPKLTYTVMYLALTFYTCYFFFIYIKRVIILTFLTIIAPLVALTYPIDKVKDSKAQAFEYWLREYIVNAITPIIHLVLYTVLVTSAIDLVVESPLYAICILAFIVPAEKIVKEMFGIKSNTSPALGGFAGGALAAQALQKIGKGKGGNGKNGGGSDKIRTKDNNNVTDPNVVEGSGLDALAAGTRTQESNDGEVPGQMTMAGFEGENGGQPQTQERNQNRNQTQDQGQNQPRNQIQEPDGGHQAADTQETRSVGAGLRAGIRNRVEALKPKIQKAPRNIEEMLRRKYNIPRGKTGRTLLKRAAVKAGKTYMRGAALIGGAAIGLAGGVVGGDMNDMWKGATIGGVAGRGLGEAAINGIGNKATAIKEGATEIFNGETEKDNIFADQEFVNDVSNRAHVAKKIEEEHPEMQHFEVNDELEKRMKEYTKYRRSGVTDIKEMDRLYAMQESLKPSQEERTNMTQEQQKERDDLAGRQAVEIAKLSTLYGSDTFRDKGKLDKATEALTQRFINANAGMQESAARAAAADAMKRVRKIKGED